MATYTYLTKDSTGNRHEGEIRADSLDVASRKLMENDQIIISLKEVDQSFDFLGPFLDEINLSFERWKNRVPLSNIVFFTRQLATMYSAGLTLERAIQGLANEERHPRFKKVLNQVGANIRKGLGLSEAFQRHPGVFSTLFVALTKAGEISGNLNDILEELAKYLENLDDTRRKVKSALTYPVVMVFFLMMMMLGMFVFIIPKFSNIYAELGAELPTATLMLVAVSQWVTANIGKIIFGSFIFTFFIWLISKTQNGGLFFDKIKLKSPVFGSLITQSILNKFCKTFGILLNAGVPVIEAMGLLRKVVGNRVYEEAVIQATDFIRDGFNISIALRRTEVFPSIMLQLAATGEETGELDSLLEHSANFYHKQVDALVERMTTLIEPLLIVAVGVIIGVMVVVTYLPVFYLGAAL
ncbi:MAG: type II secretion system F family protein [Candidatus Marinimicrobia bacterium]|nr:type II secretion system F family protein [Candidatus Neomarinimicrobiota bacterium]